MSSSFNCTVHVHVCLPVCTCTCMCLLQVVVTMFAVLQVSSARSLYYDDENELPSDVIEEFLQNYNDNGIVAYN